MPHAWLFRPRLQEKRQDSDIFTIPSMCAEWYLEEIRRQDATSWEGLRRLRLSRHRPARLYQRRPSLSGGGTIQFFCCPDPAPYAPPQPLCGTSKQPGVNLQLSTCCRRQRLSQICDRIRTRREIAPGAYWTVSACSWTICLRWSYICIISEIIRSRFLP